jgi:SAM-dependent methyltransferase
MSKLVEGFRTSHTDEGYGGAYEKVYQIGYYKDQWASLERPILQTIFQGLKKEGLRSCLDFACGTGRITAIEELYFDPCYGVDVSETMLEQARERQGGAVYIKQDLTRELLDRRFDVVTAFRFFLNAEHSLKQDALHAIGEMLEENGCLVANVHVNSSSFLGYAYRIRNRLMGTKKANILSFSEFNSYLVNAGFSIEKVYFYSYLPRIGRFYPKPYAFLMGPVEKMWKGIPLLPKSMAQCFIVVARKN